MRTVVTVICLPESGPPIVHRGWTEDLSASGVLFSSDEQIQANRMCLRMLIPGLEGRLVECSIVRTGLRASQAMLGRTGPKYYYGARFERVLSAEESEQLTRFAAERGAALSTIC